MATTAGANELGDCGACNTDTVVDDDEMSLVAAVEAVVVVVVVVDDGNDDEDISGMFDFATSFTIDVVEVVGS